jgi:hypothetical protein
VELRERLVLAGLVVGTYQSTKPQGCAPDPDTCTFFNSPHSNRACFFQGRESWGAYFGSDGNIYAGDFCLGFFLVKPS